MERFKRGVFGGNSCQKGRVAELIALEFLVERGLVLLERNWRCGQKELDLILKSRNCVTGKQILHIVEVRSLHEPFVHMPFESVDYKKQRAVIAAANGYIRVRGIDFETQFDIVSIVFSTVGAYKLEYFPDAFAPEW